MHPCSPLFERNLVSYSYVALNILSGASLPISVSINFIDKKYMANLSFVTLNGTAHTVMGPPMEYKPLTQDANF